MTSNISNHWYPAYIGLGSNLQGPVRQLEASFGALARIKDTRLIRQSSLYRSAPFGGVEQPDFVNAVASLLTQLSAQELLGDTLVDKLEPYRPSRSFEMIKRY